MNLRYVVGDMNLPVHLLVALATSLFTPCMRGNALDWTTADISAYIGQLSLSVRCLEASRLVTENAVDGKTLLLLDLSDDLGLGSVESSSVNEALNKVCVHP